MALGAVGSSTALTGALLAKGLTSDTAKLVRQDLDQSVATSTDASGKVDGLAVRAKLDDQIAADVASGKLSKDDAAAIAKVLDEVDKASDATDATPAKGAAGGGGPPGGGGGGGSSEKTELSRTVDIVGNIKTTTIKYTDGTSETKSGFTTDKSKKEAASGAASDDAKARSWLATIEPGSLVDKLA
ncbi:hypothetical protein BH10PSE13_BH10PSE13_06850 [soil metagenome]